MKARQTNEFRRWLSTLRDRSAKAILVRRIKRYVSGNPGDVRSVGDAIYEMRVPFGPGYRVYFVREKDEVILLLCGGDKGSQSSDITRAKKLAKERGEENDFEDYTV